MSRKACKRVSFSPNPEVTEEPIFPKHEGLRSSRQAQTRVVVGAISFGLRRSPARRFLRQFAARVAKTLRFISSGRGRTTSSCYSRKVSSASSLSSCSSSVYLTRSKSLAESESHRAEAIEDCIEFLNSSSSLSRSNSVSTCSC